MNVETLSKESDSQTWSIKTIADTPTVCSGDKMKLAGNKLIIFLTRRQILVCTLAAQSNLFNCLDHFKVQLRVQIFSSIIAKIMHAAFRTFMFLECSLECSFYSMHNHKLDCSNILRDQLT